MSQDSDADKARISIAKVSQLLADAHQLIGETRIMLDGFTDVAPLQLTSQFASVEAAKQIIRLRRKREKLFSGIAAGEVFGEPAWEMLLDLFVAKFHNKRIGVSSLCIASKAPPTTALRYITLMTQYGLTIRTPDETDQRRVFITLSESALGIMNAIFSD